ncbi:hypothetical protein [Janthinobacterium tructae]
MFDGPADKAWEIEGASALSRIARQAIQICSRFLLKNFPMDRIITSRSWKYYFFQHGKSRFFHAGARSPSDAARLFLPRQRDWRRAREDGRFNLKT